MTTNVPAIEFTSTGIVLPSESAILTGVQEDINQAFGGGVNPALNTPQGQLATSETAIIVDKNDQIAYILSQVDPLYAQGRWQDAIGRLYQLNRNPAEPTVVTCTLTGANGTIIPAGALAVDTSGNTYSCINSVTISSGGTVSAQFQNIVTGPIACAAGTLTIIKSTVTGWDLITNATDGVLGNDVESQSAFEYRREQALASNAQGTPAAIYGAVFALSGVTDCYVIDNPSGNVVLSGYTNYPLLPNSIYVAVVGTASNSAIAQAIWTKKDGGCNMNGNTSVSFSDPSPYGYPPPTYTIKFEIPNSIEIYFIINLVNNPSLPSNIVTLVQNAIVAQFNGETNVSRERIGKTIYVSNYFGALFAINSSVEIISAFVGNAASPTQTNQPMGIDQVPVISSGNITVNLI